MAKQFDHIEDDHRKLIEAQHMFFVGSAAKTGRVNVSPKGMDSLRVIGPNRIVWLNWTGSGNETAGHLRDVNRMTLMWCSFTKRPVILRIYGTANCLHEFDSGWDDLIGLFPSTTSARQIYDMSVELVQTSCGFAVPFMDYAGERDTLANWADSRSRDDVRGYWEQRNQTTLDGMPTGVLGDQT